MCMFIEKIKMCVKIFNLIQYHMFQVFKVEIYIAGNSTGQTSIENIGEGFIQPIDLKDSCGIVNVGLVHDKRPVGFLTGI